MMIRRATPPARKWLVVLGLVALISAGIGLALAWPIRSPDPLDRGRRAYARGDWSAASSAARDILKGRTDDPDGLRLLARSAARSGRDDLARGIYRRLGADAMRAEDCYLVGVGLLHQGRAGEARTTLEIALREDPGHLETRYELARLDLRDDRLDEASDRIGPVARAPGWEVRGGVLLGLLRDLLGDPAGAVEPLERALRLDPSLRGADLDPAEARKRLARALLEIGKPAEARRHLESVLAGGSDREAAWLLSRAALQQGDAEAAAGALERSHDFGPERPERFEPAPYVGAARCAECHRDIHRTQQASHHARTFRAAGDLAGLPWPGGPLADPDGAGVVHAFERRGDRIEARTRIQGRTLTALVAYALGSGTRGYTLVGRDEEGRDRELRMSYFRGIDGWDLTTGHPPRPQEERGYLGVAQTPDTLRACLGCHATTARAARDRSGPEAADHGIGCERCHGPGGNHLAAVAQGFPDPAIGRPKLANNERVTNLCGQCHGVARRSVAPDDEAGLLRFQATTLAKSRCSTETGAGLGCTTCHDPHRDAETAPADYEAACLACHGRSPSPDSPSTHRRPAALPADARRVACPVSPSRGCVDCHMPRRRGSMPHTAFTDHRIRADRPEGGGAAGRH